MLIYVLNLLVIWALQKDKKTSQDHYLFKHSSCYYQKYPQKKQAIVAHFLQWRNLINRFESQGQLFSVFVSPTVCVCMCWCVYLHGGSLLGWDCCWWWGTLIFFFLPPLFSLGFWQNHSTMETKKLLCDRGKPFISAGVNGGLPLITAWVITHTLTEIHAHPCKEPQSTHI